MKKKLNYNLPVSYAVDPFDNERFLKLRVKVMHAGLNLNNSNFNLDVIEAARPTLANIPLLAFVKKVDGDDSNADFGGHEYEIKITENEIKYVYLGRPIGIIPETNNYAIEQDEDGKVFVVVDAYVWKDYANSALDILNRDQVKKVSMEIIVDDYDYNNDFIDIKAYKYTGVALLGEDVKEAMLGAKAEIVKFSLDSIHEMMQELAEVMKEANNAESEKPSTIEMFTDNAEEPVSTEETKNNTATSTQETFVENKPATEYEIEIATLMNEIQTLKAENEELKLFKQQVEQEKLQAQIDALFEEFSDLDEEELAELRNANYSYEELEIRLFALRGKKVKVDNTATKVAITSDFSIAKKPEPIYADLVRQKRQFN